MISLSTGSYCGFPGKLEKTVLGSLCIILSAVLFGGMPFITKISYAYGSNAYMASFGRFLFGALLSGVILMVKARSFLPYGKQDLGQLFLLSLFYAITPLLLFESYRYIDSGLATTFHFTYSIIVMLLLWLFCHKTFTVQKLVSATLCTTGIILLGQTSSSLSLFGAIIAVLSGLTYAIYIVLLGKSTLQAMPVLTVTLRRLPPLKLLLSSSAMAFSRSSIAFFNA